LLQEEAEDLSGKEKLQEPEASSFEKLEELLNLG